MFGHRFDPGRLHQSILKRVLFCFLAFFAPFFEKTALSSKTRPETVKIDPAETRSRRIIFGNYVFLADNLHFKKVSP